jgi:acyl carrier protein
MTPDETKEKIRAYILNEIIKDRGYDLKDDERLISGGVIDSFALVHLSVFIEEHFGVVIPDTELTVENMDSVDDMVARIAKEKT